MAWEWSHTNEAYDNAYQQVCAQDSAWLEVVYAEWQVADGWDEERYEAALSEAAILTDDVLADYIWEKMSEQRTCDNGGHNAWCCPDGCHTVPFDPVEEN